MREFRECDRRFVRQHVISGPADARWLPMRHLDIESRREMSTACPNDLHQAATVPEASMVSFAGRGLL